MDVFEVVFDKLGAEQGRSESQLQTQSGPRIYRKEKPLVMLRRDAPGVGCGGIGASGARAGLGCVST